MFINKLIEEQKRKIQREKNIETSKKLLAGITIGSGLALLLAPQSGEETRNDIKEKSLELSEEVKTSIENKKEELDNFKNTLQQIKSDIRERAAMGIGPIEEENNKEEIQLEIEDITIEESHDLNN